jgi:hypothetical protein
MPISIQLSEGLLTPEGEREVFSRMAAALLNVHGLGDNPFMIAAVIGHVHVYPDASCYAGGKSQSLAVIELKVPPVTFPTQDIKDAFVELATDIIDQLKSGVHPKARTFVNVTYATEGAWGIGGKAYTNAALGEAIATAAA